MLLKAKASSLTDLPSRVDSRQEHGLYFFTREEAIQTLQFTVEAFWRQFALWVTDTQVKQDLIISRALVSIYQSPFLSERLAFQTLHGACKIVLDGKSPRSTKLAQKSSKIGCQRTEKITQKEGEKPESDNPSFSFHIDPSWALLLLLHKWSVNPKPF